MNPTGAFPDRQAQQEWAKVINWDGVKTWHSKYTPYLLQTPDDEIKLLQYYSQKIRDFTLENQLQYQNLKFDLENTRKVLEVEKEKAIETLSKQIRERMEGLSADLDKMEGLKQSILELAQKKIAEEENKLQQEVIQQFDQNNQNETIKLNNIQSELEFLQKQSVKSNENIEQKFQNDYNDLSQTFHKQSQNIQLQEENIKKF